MTGFKSPFARKSTLALTMLGGTMAILGGAKANAQSAAVQEDEAAMARNSAYGSNCSTACQEIMRDALNKAYAPPVQQTNVDPYVKQAQAIFATNADGSYKNPIANAAVKLYADAVSNGFANNPGLYKPFENYFDGLTPQNKDVFVAAFIPTLQSTLFGNKTYSSVDTYVGYKQYAKSDGEISIVQDLIKHVLTLPPSSVASTNIQRQILGIIFHKPLPNGMVATVATKPSRPIGPGGQ